ncbi:MAG: MFS transporter [bacterium]|nr:MFS transporter [bacterium]
MRPSRSVVLIALATAFSLLGDQTLYAVLPTYYTQIGLLPYQVGLILSVNRWIRLLTNHLAERLCRKHSLTLLLCLALALGAITTAIYGTAPVFSVLLASRILWGLSWSFIRQIGLMTVVDSAPQGAIGQMMGYYNGISRLGSVGGNLVGAMGHDLIGFTLTLAIFGALSLLGIPLGFLSRWKLPHIERNVDTGVPSLSWRNPGLLLSGFAVGCVGPGLMMSTLGSILQETVGDSLTLGTWVIGVATLNGLLLAARWVTDGLSAPFLGAISDRIGRRNAAVLFFGIGALSLFVASRTSSALPMIVMVLLFFICGVGATVVMFSEAGTRGPRAVATYVTASDFGSAAGPMLGWTTLQFALPSSLIFIIGGTFYALASLVAHKTFHTNSGDQP